MADELGSGDLLLGAMPKKFQILKKTRIGFLKIRSKVMNFLMKFTPFMQLRFSGFCLILLISCSMLHASEWGTLFRWKTNEGIRWMKVGEESIHDHYQGEIQDGLPHGQGRMQYVGGSSYSGEWDSGLYQGLGTLVREDGSYLIGQFEQSLPHGTGEEYLANGFKNTGEWKEGNYWNITRFDAEGEIIEKLAAGEVVQEIDYGEIRFRKWEKDHWVWLEQGNPEEHGRYQGQVNGLLPHGKGSYLSPLGVKYDGLWEEGLEHGTGILTHPNGMRSEGEFREGKPWNTRAYDSNRKLLFRVQQGTIIRKNDD